MTKPSFSPGVRCETGVPSVRVKKILVPVDFSPASKNACQYARRFAQKFEAELTLLYVLAPALLPDFSVVPGGAEPGEPYFSNAGKELQALAAAAPDGTMHWTMRAGVPSHEIVELAKETDADLIVMATHGHTGWKHFCIGSTAERVVRAAPCSVLVVREKEHAFC